MNDDKWKGEKKIGIYTWILALKFNTYMHSPGFLQNPLFSEHPAKQMAAKKGKEKKRIRFKTSFKDDFNAFQDIFNLYSVTFPVNTIVFVLPHFSFL